MEPRDAMLGLLRSRRDGFSLPGPFYVDPDVFRIDMETIWYRAVARNLSDAIAADRTLESRLMGEAPKPLSLAS